MDTILICDDHKQIRNLLTEAVGAYRPSARLLQAADGEEALEILKNESVDLLFLDVDMPKLDGFSTLTQLRQVFPPQRQPWVVMVTGRNEERDLVRSWNLDTQGYVTKPFNLDEITSALDDYDSRARASVA